MGAVLGPPLPRDLRYATVFDAKFFTQKGACFVKPVGLCREPDARI